MTVLVRPTIQLYESFRESLDEWRGDYQDGAGIRDETSLRTPGGFAAWVAALALQEDRPAVEGFVCCSYFWILDDGEYAGAIALRHELNDHLLNVGGHVGYSVRPSRRGRGLATGALRDIRGIASARGMNRLLLTCAEDNAASRRVILANSGMYEDTRVGDDGQRTMRFWVPTEGLGAITR